MLKLAELRVALIESGVRFVLQGYRGDKNKGLLTLKQADGHGKLLELCKEIGIQVDRSGLFTYVLTAE